MENSRFGQLFSCPSSGLFLPLLPLHPNLKVLGEHLKGGKFIVQVVQLAAEDALIVPPFFLQRVDLGDPAVHHRRAGDVGVDEVLHPFLVKLHLPAHGDVELLGHLVPLLLVVQHIHTVDDELATVPVVGIEGLDEVLEQRHLLHMGAGNKEQLAVDGDGQGFHPGKEKVGQTFHLLAGGAALVEPEQLLCLLAVIPGVHQAVHSQVIIPHLVGLPIHPKVGQFNILVGGLSESLLHQFPADDLGGLFVVPAIDLEDLAALGLSVTDVPGGAAEGVGFAQTAASGVGQIHRLTELLQHRLFDEDISKGEVQNLSQNIAAVALDCHKVAHVCHCDTLLFLML